MDFNYNDLLLEADDEAKEEEKKDDEKKEEEKKEDEKKDEDKKEESKDKDDESSDEDDSEYNDLIDDDIDSSIDDDIDNDTDDEYNDLIDDTETSDDINDDTEPTEDSGDDYNTLIVVKTGEAGSGSIYDKLAKLGYLYTVIANNMKHIHLNSAGRKFEEIHRQSEEYYNHFNYKCDQYFELAAESPITKLDNPTRSKEHVEDIDVESSENYTFESAVAAMSSNFNKAIDYLKSTRADVSDDRTDIQSTLDEELTYLNKQYNFILCKKMISDDTVTPTAPEAAMESYNWLI